MHEELVTRNVALLIDMPQVSKDRGTAWSAREAIAFLRSVRAHRLYAACVLVLVLKDLKTESSQAVLPLPEFCAVPWRSGGSCKSWNGRSPVSTGSRSRTMT